MTQLAGKAQFPGTLPCAPSGSRPTPPYPLYPALQNLQMCKCLGPVVPQSAAQQPGLNPELPHGGAWDQEAESQGVGSVPPKGEPRPLCNQGSG